MCQIMGGAYAFLRSGGRATRTNGVLLAELEFQAVRVAGVDGILVEDGDIKKPFL